jgi:hypothetical protein
MRRKISHQNHNFVEKSGVLWSWVVRCSGLRGDGYWESTHLVNAWGGLEMGIEGFGGKKQGVMWEIGYLAFKASFLLGM